MNFDDDQKYKKYHENLNTILVMIKHKKIEKFIFTKKMKKKVFDFSEWNHKLKLMFFYSNWKHKSKEKINKMIFLKNLENN